MFSQAAKDPEPTIVRLAFDTMEKIVREHFTVITETDVGVFADCVNCLTCFTNQSHDDNVALNAIAFLRFCAIRLAEGSIGDVDNLPEEVRALSLVLCAVLGREYFACRHVAACDIVCTFAFCWCCWAASKEHKLREAVCTSCRWI